MKKYQIVSFAAVLIVAAALRFPLITKGFFAFTYDQGRDLLAVADIVENKNLTLIGPTTGLPGIFYGPWWYYFLSPLFFVSQGNVETIALVFAVIGEVTVLLLFFLVKKITQSLSLSLIAAATAAMSQPFLTSSSQIWSPSLVLPLMTAYLFSLYQIFQKPKAVWFLILGLSCGALADSGAAFGTVLTAATVLAAISARSYFFKKDFLFFFLGLMLVLLPRIVFDVRNDFLITKSILSWIASPNIYQEKLTIFERAVARLDLFYLNFAQTFAQSNKAKAIVPLAMLLLLVAADREKIFKNPLFKFVILVMLLIYVGFVIYPDAVWDYYLAGLPAIFIVLFVLAATHLQKQLRKAAAFAGFILIALNFQPKILSPFSITWQGDGAIWRNQIKVVDDLKGELKGHYSLHVYSPAGFDYPFWYITSYYHKRGLVDLPKEGQRRMYLVIRDDSTHSYLPSGWYGDKTKDRTKLLAKKEYVGNIIVERHELND